MYLYTTRNDPTTLCIIPDILFWCLDTESHRKNLIRNFSFQPNAHYNSGQVKYIVYEVENGPGIMFALSVVPALVRW